MRGRLTVEPLRSLQLSRKKLTVTPMREKIVGEA